MKILKNQTKSYCPECLRPVPARVIASDKGRIYLEWRYKHHPVHHFKILAAEKQGELKGFVVLRTETEGSLKKGLIVDFLTTMGDCEAI